MDAPRPRPALTARAVVLGLLVLLFLRILRDPANPGIVSGANLVMHEAGHLALWWSGVELLAVAGGTLFQVAIPALVGWMFHRQGDRFAVTVAAFWLGINLVDVGVYAADARARALPLVSPFPGEPIHDWHRMLGAAGLLEYDTLVGRAFHDVGVVAMAGALVWGARTLRRTAFSPDP